jgi:hypothetical protein
MPEEAKHSTSATPALPTDQMLTEDVVATILDVSPSWLAKARMRGEGPPFIKFGRNVRYFPLGPWLAARRRPSTKKRRPPSR